MERMQYRQERLVKALFGQLQAEFEDWENVWSVDVHDVEHQSRDGFIPFTNGGYHLWASSSLRDAECYINGREAAILQPYINSSYEDAAKDFLNHRRDTFTDLGLDVDKALDADDVHAALCEWFDAKETEYNGAPLVQPQLPVIEPPPHFWSTPTGVLREEWHEYSEEYLSEGGEFWYQVKVLYFTPDNRRNESGEPEIFLFAGVNTDFTYGRDRGLESTYEINLPVREITAARLRQIRKDLMASFQSTDEEKANVAA